MDPREGYKSMGVSEDTARLLVHNDDMRALNNRSAAASSYSAGRGGSNSAGAGFGQLILWGGGAFIAFALLLAFIEATQAWVRASFSASTVQWSLYAIAAFCIGLRGWLTGRVPLLFVPEIISLLMMIVAGTYFAVWVPDWAYFTPEFLPPVTALVFGVIMVWQVVFAKQEPRFRAAFNEASRPARLGRFALSALKWTVMGFVPLGLVGLGLAWVGYLDMTPQGVMRGLVGPWIHLAVVIFLVLVALDLRRGRALA